MTGSPSGATLVGSLACQRDSFYRKDFETIVLKCDKALKNDNYEIELLDTILFPEGGGQPSDTGKIEVLGSNRTIIVSLVFRSRLRAVHLVDEYVQPGSKVRISIDWDRRLDFMQQHTGQHLLSALLENEWGLKTVSWSMGGVPTPKRSQLGPSDFFNYIEIERKLSKDEVSKLSLLCNRYITVDPQKIEVIERKLDSTGPEVDTSKIPDNYDLEKGTLRTIDIGQLDSNPCCGTHLKNTFQIGSIFISPAQSSVRGSNSRLSFMCGSRVLNYTDSMHSIVNSSKVLLSCGEIDVPQKLKLQRDANQKSVKREQFWMKQAAGSTAENLIGQLGGKKKAHLVMDEYGMPSYISCLQKELASRILLRKLDRYLVVLCGRDKATGAGTVLISSDSCEEIDAVSTKLSKIVSKLKGGTGNKGGKWQGKVTEFGKGEWTTLCQYLCELY
ncbi:LAQU0S01e01464g1_1 [Lachancea quebecensis]|uniref:LAQU0S01e01464g1_1 n=1 Tax=Lachancea quebecensis TaxID=1654605 RepID=A0A0P1KKV2_9SACH|nr:LAQU0S01e01464g1_1 [Lachancea quebecensis]